MALEGTVTFDGQPLKHGVIQFKPLPGTSGPTAGANIDDGKYVVPARGGPFVGEFRVAITAEAPTGRKVADPMTGRLVDEYSQFLPAAYNRESTLRVNIVAGKTNVLDFQLESDKKGTM